MPATPVFLNTGGGVFGSIRQRVKERANLRDAFGERVHPGRQPPGTNFPYVILKHQGGSADSLVTAQEAGPDTSSRERFDVWKEVIQVSVYTDNYESSRQLGRLLHVHLSRQTLLADCVPVTLFPDSRNQEIEPSQTGTGADVWHADYRYHYWTADKLFPDEGVAYG
jgi:hypothetical protein